jgi:hypothetical protein
MSNTYRRDNRSKEEFKNDIEHYIGTVEKLWGEILLEYFRQKVDLDINVALAENSNDGSSDIVDGKLDDVNADKKFMFYNGNVQDGINIVDEKIIEIKSAPQECEDKWDFFTFKLYNLIEYIDQRASILVPMRDHGYLFSTEAIKCLVAGLCVKKYRGFGNKDAVRIGVVKPDSKYMKGGYDPFSVKDLIDEGLVERLVWFPEQQKTISDNYDVLFNRRRRK